MDEYLEDQLKINEWKLRTRDFRNLRVHLREIEQKVASEVTSGEDEVESCLRQLWFKIVTFSCLDKNIELALLAIAKLKLTQLALTVKSTLQSNESKLGELMALRYVTDFFHIDFQTDAHSEAILSTKYDFFSCQNVVEYHMSSCDWEDALKFVDQNLNQKEAHLINQLIIFDTATYHEYDENLSEALVHIERLDLPRGFDMIRLILKLFQDFSYPELRRYFSSISDPNSLDCWVEFSHCCGKFDDVSAVLKRRESITSFVKYNSKRNLSLVEKEVLDKLPEKMLKQLKDVKVQNWMMKKRKAEYLISIASSLSTDLRATLSELSYQYEQAGFLWKACSLYLIIGQYQRLLSILNTKSLRVRSGARGSFNKLTLTSNYGTVGELLHALVDYIEKDLSDIGEDTTDSPNDEPDFIQTDRSDLEPLFKTCLRMGLIDKALQVLTFSSYTMKNNENIVNAIEVLKNVILDKDDRRALDSVDPTIQSPTLQSLYKSIQNSSQTLSTNVITIVIHSTNIFLLKLNPLTHRQHFNARTSNNGSNRKQVLLDRSLENLETMFKKLVEYLGGLNFNASDDLINATNLLILAVKDKLETLSESDIIRESLKDLIEQIASRCMIESQYKSAAMLYSQIEDNVSAIKSLMRMGDVEVVINYSLLVRDITVNRLTINFLKHLQVDAAVLKDFIAKSKI